jgi:hypothetical protein
MKYRKPSRTINEKAVLLGLDFSDLIGLALFLLFLQVCLKPFHLEFFALLLTCVAMSLLVPLRLRFRRRIIRDFLFKIIGPKVIYVSKSNRDN